MDKPMMKCGHSANGHRRVGDNTNYTNIPACVICGCIEIASTPNLENRMARCTTCGKANVPSRMNLAFFEYRGKGSRAATRLCKNCGCLDSVHLREGYHCKNFEPHDEYEFDSYYCGCRGWD